MYNMWQFSYDFTFHQNSTSRFSCLVSGHPFRQQSKVMQKNNYSSFAVLLSAQQPIGNSTNFKVVQHFHFQIVQHPLHHLERLSQWKNKELHNFPWVTVFLILRLSLIFSSIIKLKINICWRTTNDRYTTAELVASVSPALLPASLGGTCDKSGLSGALKLLVLTYFAHIKYIKWLVSGIDLAVGKCLSAMEEHEKEVEGKT